MAPEQEYLAVMCRRLATIEGLLVGVREQLYAIRVSHLPGVKLCGRYYADRVFRCCLARGHGGMHATGSGAEWPDSSCAVSRWTRFGDWIERRLSGR